MVGHVGLDERNYRVSITKSVHETRSSILPLFYRAMEFWFPAFLGLSIKYQQTLDTLVVRQRRDPPPLAARLSLVNLHNDSTG